MRRSPLYRRLLALSGAVAVSVGLAVAAPGAAQAATLQVTSLNDSGAGSLRQAILDANLGSGADTITFALPGPAMIQLTSELPAITAPVSIEGYSQDLGASSPPVRIEQQSGNASAILAFAAGSDGSSLTGVSIGAAAGQVVTHAVLVQNDNMVVDGNWIALNAAGTAGDDGDVLDGIYVLDNADPSANASNAEIIGNVIGDAEAPAIYLGPGTSSDVIASNTIGGTPDGNTSLTGTTQGISLNSANVETVNYNNIVGLGGSYAIEVNGGNLDNLQGNRIGLLNNGSPIPGTGPDRGIWIHGAAANLTVNNNFAVAAGSEGVLVDGGDGAVSGSSVGGNTIYSDPVGVRLLGANNVVLSANSIHDTGIGIKHGTGSTPSAQDSGGGPTLSNISAGSGDVDLTFDGPASFASQDVEVQFFLNTTCNSGAGVGDGETYLASDTLSLDASSHGSKTFTLGDQSVSFQADDHVTATISPLLGTGSTTEFSNCFTVPTGPTNHEPFTFGADPNPASVGLNQTVDVTLTGTDEDGDHLTFGLPGGGTSNNGSNAVALLGSPSCDGNTPSTCTQVARYTASTPFLGPDIFTWTVDDGTVTAPAASAEVDVVNAGLRMTNVLWFDAGYVPGSPTSMQAFAVNDGPDSAHNTVMTVSAPGGGPLPAGVSLVSGNGINDAVNAGSCTETAGVITCPIGDLQSLGLAGVDLTLSTSGATPDPLTVKATISSDTPDAFSANNTYTSPGLPAVAPGTADLAVGTLVDTPDPVTAGGDVQYTTTVTNNGPDAATGIQVKLNGDSSGSLPAFTSFVSGTAGSATCTSTSGGPVLCPVGSLASGDSVSVTIYLQSDLVSSLTTTPVQVSVTSSSTDPNSADDSSSTSTTINPSTGGDTTVFVPPSTDPQTVATGPIVDVRGDVIPVATSADPVGAAITIPPDGPGGVVTVDELACAAPFRCPGDPRTGTQPTGSLIAGSVVQFVPPNADFYDYAHPLTYTVTYDKTQFSATARFRVYYVKDGAPDVLVRARTCGGTPTAATVFPCLKGVKILKSPDPDVRGDLRVRLLATWDDPKIGTYKG